MELTAGELVSALINTRAELNVMARRLDDQEKLLRKMVASLERIEQAIKEWHE